MKSERRRSRPWQSWLRWGGTLLAVGLLIWLLERQDWQQLLQAAGSVGVQVLLLSQLFVLIGHLFNVGRWYALLRTQEIDMGIGGALQLTFAGLFASNFLPTTIGGDLLRLVGVMQASKQRFKASTTIVMDRMVGVLGMLLVLPLGVPILLEMIADRTWLGGGGLLLGRPWAGLWRSLSRRLETGLRIWLSNPGAVLLSLAFNLAGIASYLLSVWLVADAMGIAVSYIQVAGAVSLTYFLTLLPISVNGYGVRELGVVAVFVQLGATPEQASALALITRGLIWAASLPGVLWVGAVLRAAGDQLGDLRLKLEGGA